MVALYEDLRAKATKAKMTVGLKSSEDQMLAVAGKHESDAKHRVLLDVPGSRCMVTLCLLACLYACNA